MDIDDIVFMPMAERTWKLVGDMPWVTENLTKTQIADLQDMIDAMLKAAILQDREERANMAASVIRGNSKL